MNRLKFRNSYYEVFSFEKLDAVAEYYLLGNDNDWNNKEDDRKEILSKFSENNSPIFETPIGAEFILAVNDDEDYFERRLFTVCFFYPFLYDKRIHLFQ